jgi:hypothetical protein
MNKAGFNSTSTNTFSIGDGYTAFKYIYVNTASVNKPGIRYNTTLNYFEESNDGTTWTRILGTNNIVPIFTNYTTKYVNIYETANTIVKNPTNTITQYQVYNNLRKSDGYTHLSICNFAVSSYNNTFKFVGFVNTSPYTITSEQCCTSLETDDAYSSVKYVLDGYTGILNFQYKSSVANVICKSVILPVVCQNSTIQYSTFNRSADWWNGKTCSEWELTRTKLLESQILGGGPPTVHGYVNNSGVTPLAGSGVSSIITSDNNVYIISASSPVILQWHYINTNTGNVTAYTHGATVVPVGYFGGVLTPNGRIYMIPRYQSDQSSWHYINTKTNTVTAYSHGITAVVGAYVGGVLAPNGRIYMMPYAQSNQTNWHYIDSNTGTVSAYAHGATVVANAYYGGALAPNGRIYMMPHAQANQTTWHYIDTNTNSVVAYAHGITIVAGTYLGATLAANGNIYLIPYLQSDQANWHYINTTTGVATAYSQNSGVTPVSGAYIGGVYSPDGRIYLIPYAQSNQTYWHYIDTNTNTVVAYAHGITAVASGYWGGSLAPNGRIYMSPNFQADQTTWHYIETNCEKNLSGNICINPMFNKF